MSHSYKIIIETNEGQQVVVADGTAKDPESIIDLGMRHSEQIAILQKIQDQILKLQSTNLQERIDSCPRCHHKLQRFGDTKSDFHSVFTDHKVSVRRLKCSHCKWKSVPSIKSLFGVSMHPDLTKLHCELGAKHSYRAAEAILNQQSYHKRRINNHERILHVVESVGDYVSDRACAQKPSPTKKASSLILQVDGGHLKDKNPENRSFEAMAAVTYRPEDVRRSDSGKRGEITKKQCSASALSDHQSFMKEATIQAFTRAGGDKSTHLTALCDGASNCWSIVQAVQAQAGKTTCILDWFHISMKFQNTRLGKKASNEALTKAKWCIWHGNVKKGIGKLNELKSQFKPEEKQHKDLCKLATYISNNARYIVNYEQRSGAGLIFTSNVAESTIESLINQRCKGKKHMKWTRAGVHPLLQIRAVSITKEWQDSWLDFVMGSIQKAA